MTEFVRYSIALAVGFTSLLFLHAAYVKFAEAGRFEGVLAAYRLIPETFQRPMSIAIPWAELVTAGLLILPWTQNVGGVFAFGLLSIYAAAIAINLIRQNVVIDCGCGDEPEPLSWALVVRNSVLCLLMVGAALGMGQLNGAVEMTVIGTLSLLVAVFFFMSQKAFANVNRMRNTLSSGTQATIGGMS